jgi:hypothetical protein
MQWRLAAHARPRWREAELRFVMRAKKRSFQVDHQQQRAKGFFFFEKKKQKTFAHFVRQLARRGGTGAARNG